MIKLGGKNFLMVDRDGDEIPFSMTELQGELIYCFLSAGMSDSSCFAEDIALAVEYSLQGSGSFNGRISCDTLAAMVAETLENAGFFAVAECFKERNGRRVEVLFSTEFESLQRVALEQGLAGCDDVKILKDCSNAFKAMGVSGSPMGLIVEMVRFFRDYRKEEPNEKVPEKNRPSGNYYVSPEDVHDELPETLRIFLDNEIVRLNGITVYHPSIRIYFDCIKYAEFRKLQPVMTEMMWMDYGAEIGQSLDAGIEVLQRKYNTVCPAKELPVYLTISRMDIFLKKYFGVSGENGKVGPALIESLTANMVNEVYKVRF